MCIRDRASCPRRWPAHEQHVHPHAAQLSSAGPPTARRASCRSARSARTTGRCTCCSWAGHRRGHEARDGHHLSAAAPGPRRQGRRRRGGRRAGSPSSSRTGPAHAAHGHAHRRRQEDEMDMHTRLMGTHTIAGTKPEIAIASGFLEAPRTSCSATSSCRHRGLRAAPLLTACLLYTSPSPRD